MSGNVEIGFAERFALASDRNAVLNELLSGTDDYFYYRILHLLNTGTFKNAGSFKDVDRLLEEYKQAFRYNHPRYDELWMRRQLIAYGVGDKALVEQALGFLKDKFLVSFDDEREVTHQADDEPPAYPDRIDPASVDTVKLMKALVKSSPQAIDGFHATAMDWLLSADISKQQRRALLSRLTAADHGTALVKAIADDLDWNDNGFTPKYGYFAVHRMLSLQQMQDLLAARPLLVNDTSFFSELLQRMVPTDDVDLTCNPAEMVAYIDRLLAFVTPRAGPALASLRSALLFRRIKLDLELNTIDEGRLVAYLEIPKSSGVCSNAYRQKKQEKQPPATLFERLNIPLVDAIEDDKEIVSDYLARIFAEPSRDSFRPFDTYIEDTFVKRVFAESRLMAGVGKPEQLTAMLGSQADVERIRSDVVVAFCPDNRRFYGALDPVRVLIDVKNVPSLTVKVFEMNMLAFYRENSDGDVNANVNLDGLVATVEQTITCTEPPIRKVRRAIDLPQCAEAGVYVVEIIGGGKSTRAIIRKGRLRFVERTGVAGHVISVVDEDGASVGASCTVTLIDGGAAPVEYAADTDGTVAIPFTTRPGRRVIVLTKGKLCTRGHFDHAEESYALQARFSVDKGSLVAGNPRVDVIVTPTLRLCGRTVTTRVLEDAYVTVKTVDSEGITASRRYPVALSDNEDTVVTFAMPERVSALEFVLTAAVKKTDGTKEALSASMNVAVSDSSSDVDNAFFRFRDGQYEVCFLGRTGEPRVKCVCTVRLHHRYLVNQVTSVLQSDADGIVKLGSLADIESIDVAWGNRNAQWTVPRDQCRHPSVIPIVEGSDVVISAFSQYVPLGAVPVSVRELRRGTNVRDCSSKAIIGVDGLARISGLERGVYSVRVNVAWHSSEFTVMVAPRTARPLGGRYAVTPTRVLDVTEIRPAHIGGVEQSAPHGSVRVRVANATAGTRVHCVLGHFVDANTWVEASFGRESDSPSDFVETNAQPSDYVAARVLGDEEKYVIDRRQKGTLMVGNMLARPSLLIKPFAVGDAKTAVVGAEGGSAYGASAAPKMYRSAPMVGGMCAAAYCAPSSVSCDFLEKPTVVLANLRPSADGYVDIPRSAVEASSCSLARIVVIDGASVQQRLVPLTSVSGAANAARPYRDLRQLTTLDPARHYMEQKESTVLTAGGEVIVQDPKACKIEIYDSIAKVFRLLQALHPGDAALTDYDFLLRWDGMAPAEKRRLYAANACHELNFFLFKRDPAFFSASVRPLLTNKLDKSFVDRFLLGESLAEYELPSRFERLNVFERSLLALRAVDAADKKSFATSVAEMARGSRVTPREEARLFGVALGGTALDGSNDEDGDHDEHDEHNAGSQDGSESDGQNDEMEEMHIEQQSLRGAPAMPGMMSMARGGAPMMTRMARGAPGGPPGGAPPMFIAMAMPPPPPMGLMMMSDGSANFSSVAFDADTDGDMLRREAAPQRALYRGVDKTKELAETYYLKMRANDDTRRIVRPSAFWTDYACHCATASANAAFLSKNLHLIGPGATDGILAIAVLGLPLQLDASAGTPVTVQKERARIVLRAQSGSAVVYSRQTREIAAEGASAKQSDARVMVFETTTRKSEHDGGSDDEDGDGDGAIEAGTEANPVIPHCVYRTRVVLSNASGKLRRVEVMVQIPEGALPVGDSKYTSSQPKEIPAFSMVTVDYTWYMPSPGNYAHYPAQVTCAGSLIGWGTPRRIVVSAKAGVVAGASWEIVSQSGTEAQVLDMMRAAQRPSDVPLARIAWRAKQRSFFTQCVSVLRARRWYDPAVWKYALEHSDAGAIAEWLSKQCVPASLPAIPPLLRLGPTARGQYEHLEYSPLVNARAHVLSSTRKIPNATMAAQYTRFLQRVSQVPQLSHEDRLEAAHYLLIQDRTAEARDVAGPVLAAGDVMCAMQRDYLAAYLEFYDIGSDLTRAAAIAERYSPATVGRWGDMFADVKRHVAEVRASASALSAVASSGAAGSSDGAAAAAAGPAERSLSFEVSGGKVSVTCRGLEGRAGEARFYAMDTELLFSSNPFVQQNTGRFLYVRPNRVVAFIAPADAGEITIEMPAEFATRNSILEVCIEDVRRTAPVYSSGLSVQISEAAGTLRVTSTSEKRPIPGAYVKVYSERDGGAVNFYKDGYTDLRGCFDYVSLSTDDLDTTRKFALLVATEKLGSVVRECAPPKR